MACSSDIPSKLPSLSPAQVPVSSIRSCRVPAGCRPTNTFLQRAARCPSTPCAPGFDFPLAPNAQLLSQVSCPQCPGSHIPPVRHQHSMELLKDDSARLLHWCGVFQTQLQHKHFKIGFEWTTDHSFLFPCTVSIQISVRCLKQFIHHYPRDTEARGCTLFYKKK